MNKKSIIAILLALVAISTMNHGDGDFDSQHRLHMGNIL